MAKLVVTIPDQDPVEHELGADETTIGRVNGNAIVIGEGSVSSQHAKILRSEGRYVFEDLHSTNGSFLNGNQVRSTPLDSNDKLTLGVVECVFVGDPVERPASLPKPPRELPREPKHAAPAAG